MNKLGGKAGNARERSSFARVTMAATVAVALFAWLAPAYGTSLTPTPRVTVTEGYDAVLVFSLANTSANPIMVTNWDLFASHVTGDSSDSLFGAAYQPHLFTSCNMLVAPGSGCYMLFHFVLPPPAVVPLFESDEDSGTQIWTLFVTADDGLTLSSSTELTIDDPTVAPEPASLLLFATGALVLGAACLRRHHQRRPAL
jgi:hypothetical protein